MNSRGDVIVALRLGDPGQSRDVGRKQLQGQLDRVAAFRAAVPRRQRRQRGLQDRLVEHIPPVIDQFAQRGHRMGPAIDEYPDVGRGDRESVDMQASQLEHRQGQCPVPWQADRDAHGLAAALEARRGEQELTEIVAHEGRFVIRMGILIEVGAPWIG
jgi:hypothetical protein